MPIKHRPSKLISVPLSDKLAFCTKRRGTVEVPADSYPMRSGARRSWNGRADWIDPSVSAKSLIKRLSGGMLGLEHVKNPSCNQL